VLLLLLPPLLLLLLQLLLMLHLLWSSSPSSVNLSSSVDVVVGDLAGHNSSSQLNNQLHSGKCTW